MKTQFPKMFPFTSLTLFLKDFNAIIKTKCNQHENNANFPTLVVPRMRKKLDVGGRKKGNFAHA